jgi:hypothetical protein
VLCLSVWLFREIRLLECRQVGSVRFRRETCWFFVVNSVPSEETFRTFTWRWILAYMSAVDETMKWVWGTVGSPVRHQFRHFTDRLSSWSCMTSKGLTTESQTVVRIVEEVIAYPVWYRRNFDGRFIDYRCRDGSWKTIFQPSGSTDTSATTGIGLLIDLSTCLPLMDW